MDDHLLRSKRLLVPEFADYMSKLLVEKGLTVDDLLASGKKSAMGVGGVMAASFH
jgi:hypothetical protein